VVTVGTRELIQTELKDSTSSDVILFNLSPEHYRVSDAAVLEHLTKHLKTKVIYISLNRSYTKLNAEFKDSGVDISMVYFIGLNGKGHASKLKNLSPVRPPFSLTKIGIELSKILESGQYEFLMLDSVSALTVYNPPALVKKFMHYLVSRLRTVDVGGGILMLQGDESESIKSYLSSLCDKTIKL